MVKTKGSKLSSQQRRKLLKLLTYGKVNGKPTCYQDYKRVLKGELSPEAVMGSSGLQAYKVKPYLKENKLIPVPPKAVTGIDTKADHSKYGGIEEYAHEKTQNLLDAGVERVLGIFRGTKKVMVAEKEKNG